MTISQQSDVQTYQQRLEQLNAEVQALRDQLHRAQRLATMGTMTAMVAHEFNNILTPIINYAQLARKNPALVGKAIDRAADGGQRASGICNALLGIASGQSAEPAEVNLRELVFQTLAAMAREPWRDAIDVDIDIAEDVKIRTRRVELQQVLLNLLINARKALLEKSPPRRIEISTERRDGQVVIRVADNGVGIPAENLAKVFTPFFTTRPQKDDSEGAGLGLTICRQIARALGGDIAVRSTRGEGTVFTILLPN